MLYSALIGNPVEHSCSPKLFEYLAEKANIEYSHIKILIKNSNNLLKSIKEMKNLGFCGVNVTCPYKVDSYYLLNKFGDDCDKIKSVNTIKFIGRDIIGYNTDGIAAIRALKTKKEINSNHKVVVFGAGGVARPIVYELSKLTKNIVVFNIDELQAKTMLADLKLKCKYYNLNNRAKIIECLNCADFVINCTSVGMKPQETNSIISYEEIQESSTHPKVYFDVVFNPWDTKFIQMAKLCGNEVISGGLMLIYQAIYAFEIWTGCLVELNKSEILELKEILINEINKR